MSGNGVVPILHHVLGPRLRHAVIALGLMGLAVGLAGCYQAPVYESENKNVVDARGATNVNNTNNTNTTSVSRDAVTNAVGGAATNGNTNAANTNAANGNGNTNRATNSY